MNYIKEYSHWISNMRNQIHFEELKRYSELEKEKRFSNSLKFGTGGLRAKMGLGTSELNEYTIRRATKGLAEYMKSKENKDYKVIIAYDNRKNSKLFNDIASEELLNHGVEVFNFCELTPTPLLSYYVRQYEANFGIVITASHNPKEYNGYKVYDHTGAQLNINDSNELYNVINSQDFDFHEMDLNILKKVKYITNNKIKDYINEISDNSTGGDLKIVFSPNHGTSYKILPEVLKKGGFHDICVVKEQFCPDTNFTNSKSINPEEKEAYDLANEYLVNQKYELSLVIDPDGDRVGFSIYQDGNIRYFSGNETSALIINYLIETNNYSEDSIIYKTIVTGVLGEKIAKNSKIRCIETLTGFKFIGEKINELPQYNLLIGYEESYGYLFNSSVRDKDAMQGALAICNMVQYYKNSNVKLASVLENLYLNYGYYAEKTISFSVKDKDIIDNFMNSLRKTSHQEILGYSIDYKIDYSIDETGLPKSDVIKFFLKSGGWIVIRPSGTEPKIKLYTSIKCYSDIECENIISNCESKFKELLES